MSDTTSSANDARPGDEATQDEMVRYDEVMRILDGWRARIDELRVQVDLAKLDLRDEATKQLELARDVNSVAASKLRVAYKDAAGTAETLRLGVHEFLNDINEAFDAVQSVISQD